MTPPVLASAQLYADLFDRLPETDALLHLAGALLCDEADDEITEEERAAKRQANHDRAADALDAV